MRRLICVFIAVFLPPVAVFLIKGSSPATHFALLLFCTGVAMFFVLFALPGLAIWTLSIVYALGVSIFGSRAGR